jgi:hypothetical protein
VEVLERDLAQEKELMELQIPVVVEGDMGRELLAVLGQEFLVMVVPVSSSLLTQPHKATTHPSTGTKVV